VDFCYQCPDFPCEQIKKLNNRYEKRGYGMNFTENNLRIKEIGLKKFKEEQNKKYSCPECGGEVSIHEKICYVCGYKSS
jgi:competence CoiA-like predicted nuclease